MMAMIEAEKHRRECYGSFRTASRFAFGKHITIVADIEYSTEDDCPRGDMLMVDSVQATDMSVKVGDTMVHVDLSDSDVQGFAECFSERIEIEFKDRLRSVCEADWRKRVRFGD